MRDAVTLREMTVERLGDDILVTGYPVWPEGNPAPPKCKCLDIPASTSWCRRIAPGGRLRRVRRLKGGLGAMMHVLDIEREDGTRLRGHVAPSHPRISRRLPGSLPRRVRAAVCWSRRRASRRRGRCSSTPRVTYFGVPALVLTYIPGASRYQPDDRKVWTGDLARAAHWVHAVTPERFDLSALTAFGREEVRASLAARADEVATSPQELVHDVYAALRAHIDRVEWPALRLVHDDFWPGNTVWYRGRLAAVIDWGNAQLGDPRTDVAQCQLELAFTVDLATADQFVAAYEALAGPLPQLWYFALYRGLTALISIDHWLVGYEDAGLKLDPVEVHESLDAYIRRALRRSSGVRAVGALNSAHLRPLRAWMEPSYFFRRAVAMRAPSASDSSLAKAIDGCWRTVPEPWAKPQSLLAMTFSGPTRSAYCSMRWAISSGCSTWRDRVADHARQQHLALRQLRVLPDRPLPGVARVRRLDRVGLARSPRAAGRRGRRSGTSRGVRAGPGAPAEVVAHAVLGDAAQGVVEGFEVHLRPLAVVLAAVRDRVVEVGQDGVVGLHDQAGVDDDFVLLVQGVGDREEKLLVALVVLVAVVDGDAAGRDDRQECLLDIDVLERRLEVVDVALHLAAAFVGVAHGADADRLARRGRAAAFGVEVLEAALGVPAADSRPSGARSGAPRSRRGAACVGRPARLAELAVADDVDAALRPASLTTFATSVLSVAS